jgi:hypothetical protein
LIVAILDRLDLTNVPLADCPVHESVSWPITMHGNFLNLRPPWRQSNHAAGTIAEMNNDIVYADFVHRRAKCPGERSHAGAISSTATSRAKPYGPLCCHAVFLSDPRYHLAATVAARALDVAGSLTGSV